MRAGDPRLDLHRPSGRLPCHGKSPSAPATWSEPLPIIPPNLMQEALHAEYRAVDDIVRGLERLEQQFLLRRDLRGVFATAYLQITRALERNMAAGSFIDPVWVTRYLVCFGNLYRRALLHYERGEVGAVPKAWRLSFDAARAGTGLVIQHLVLGINAHINHDLALALVEIGIDPERPQKYQDHTTVNQVLEGATATLKHPVSAMYAPVLHRLDRIAGRADDMVTTFSISKAREHAWTFAVALSSARGEQERTLLRRALDEQAAVLARLVLASPTRHPLLRGTVHMLKRIDAAVRRLPLGRAWSNRR